MKTRSSLPSLLTLAAGASALPLTADASIIYTEFGTPQTVGFGGGQLSSLPIDLPGTANLRVWTQSASMGDRCVWVSGTAARAYIGRQANARSAAVPGSHVAFRTTAGHSWGAPITATAVTARIIWSISMSAGVKGPGAFTNKYLLFKFKNSLSANQLQYGWVGMSAATVTGNMSVTLSGWAYDDSGAMIAAGAIPEPTTSAALAMGGALVLGAAGLRQWRKRKVD